MRKFFWVVGAIAGFLLLREHFAQQKAREAERLELTAPITDAAGLALERDDSDPVAPRAVAASDRSCDGRKRCSQMHSCEEATWFIRNCSGMEMDGDGDGIPCESQWCGHRAR